MLRRIPVLLNEKPKWSVWIPTRKYLKKLEVSYEQGFKGSTKKDPICP